MSCCEVIGVIMIENEDWVLRVKFEWQSKPKQINCSVCNGKGFVGGGMFSLDNNKENCNSCGGRGKVSKSPDFLTRPVVPPELVEHMRRAYWDFVNKK